MTNQTVAVIGGSGFLGRYVVKHLAQAGYRVRILSRRPTMAEFVKPSGTVGQIACDFLDLTKPASISGKLNGTFAVINLAGILKPSGRQKFDAIQAKGAELLALEARRAGVRQFIQVSALGVDRVKGSHYASSKLAGEASVRALFPQSVIIRPSVLFGAEDDFFNQFARLSVISPALPLIGGGKTRFQPAYVDDVAQAIVISLTHPAAAGSIIELGGDETLTFRQVLEFIAQITGRKPCLLPVPFPLASLGAALTGWLPMAPLTTDQVRLLKSDNVVSGNHPGFAALGITPQSLQVIVPRYLGRFNK